MENINMSCNDFKISRIVETASEAKKTLRVADKSVFEQIFEQSCRQLGGRAINSYNMWEERLC